MSTISTAIDFRDPAYRTDPYPYLEMLRRYAPVCQVPSGFWLVTRYEDVNTLNRDPRLGRDLRKWAGYEEIRPYLADSPLEKCAEQWMFSLDPPAQTRLRRLFAKAFTPRIVNAMRQQITSIADTLLAGLTGEFDFMSQFAQPLPVRVITGLLDLPQADYAQLKAWSDALVVVVEPVASKASRKLASDVAVEMMAYLQDHLRHYDKEDTFLGELLAATRGEALSEDELVANLVLLFVAGHETTTNWLGNGLLALLRHPDQMIRLRQKPELMATAVEELLRYDSPANINARVNHQEIEMGGQTIPTGSLIFCMLGAANRDETIFAEPNRLDIGRNPNPHVSFGGGPHYCLGAPLARLEAQIAFNQILQCWPVIKLDENQVVWRDLVNVRGLERLVISIQ